jgi:hypothetical protein
MTTTKGRLATARHGWPKARALGVVASAAEPGTWMTFYDVSVQVIVPQLRLGRDLNGENRIPSGILSPGVGLGVRTCSFSPGPPVLLVRKRRGHDDPQGKDVFASSDRVVVCKLFRYGPTDQQRRRDTFASEVAAYCIASADRPNLGSELRTVSSAL